MKSLPLSVNGKIDTKNLPIPSQRRDLLTTNYRAPSTEVEHVVHKIWCEALKFDQIGVDDNYFEINGDSLKALMIVSRINQAGYQCDVSSLFKKSTISLLAKSITPIEKSEPIASESLDQPFDSLSVDELESLSAIISKSTR